MSDRAPFGGSSPKPVLWAIVLFVLLPLIPLHKAVFAGEAIGPFDQIRQMAPWNGPKPDAPWDVLQADGVLQFYPWRAMVLDSWGKGQLPLWNPHQLAGTPLLANSQSAGFYPPHMLLGILHVPTPTAMTLLAWLHLFWAGLGCYVLTRRLGANEAGSCLAGASFCLSAFMISWVALPSVISTVAWIPWLLASILLLERNRNVLRTISAIGFCVGMLLLAGHLQFAAYGLMAAALLTLWTVLSQAGILPAARLTKLGIAFGGLALGGMLAAPQILPVLEYQKQSHRQSTPSEEGYAAYSASAIQLWELTALSGTNLGGLPNAWAATKEPLPSYYPEFFKRGANYAESAIGVGPLIFVLLAGLIAGFKLNWRKCGGVASVGLLGLLLAMGSIVGRLLYFALPGWSSSGSPGRAEVLFVLAACVIAGIVASNGRPAEEKPSFKPVILPVLLVLSLSPLMMGRLPASPYDSDGAWAPTLANAVYFQMLPLAAVAAVLAMVAMAWWLKDQHRGGWGMVAAGVIGLSMMHALTIVPTSQATLPAVQSDPNTRIAAVNDSWEIVSAAAATLPPNCASTVGLNDLGGYDSLLDRDTVALLKDIDGQDAAPPANGNMMFIKPTADVAKLAEAGVDQVWSTKYDPHFGTPVSSEGGIYRYALATKGRAYSDQGAAKILEDGYDRQTILATGPGVLWVKDRNMEGWTAQIDGSQKPMAHGLWRSVEIPAGEHKIEFRYWPPGLSLGFALGLIGWLGFAAFSVLGRSRVKSGRDSGNPAVE